MADAQIGWIAAIIIGGIAGWIASALMKSENGLLLNVILGVLGAAVASVLFGVLGISFGGWIGYLVAGIIGACILIVGSRVVRR
ncbi:GlsB/YeaQ/YmgE family stress response membrane protein [Xanthobacter variabilis]|uniref:GlsB/YeaQ/YmgE family stress response membrane protein n=1 Tax=Xanthobacter variabilis TaxID=3119932 RepID=UPI003727D4F4